jgi:hypothetical protein
VKEELSRLMD